MFEPRGELNWSNQNQWGEMRVSVNAAAYLFTEQHAYSHALYELKLSQTFKTDTKIQIEYELIPDLYLGKNEYFNSQGAFEEEDEQLAVHFWAMQLDQKLSENVLLRLMSRYGLRDYREPFKHRNTQFWTVGPHLEWEISPTIELLIGYHFEQGFAQVEQGLNYADDVSYINHYASAELSVMLSRKLKFNLIFDFEKNDFTTPNPRDEHYLAYETVYQGEVELMYELNQALSLKLGWQGGFRRLNTETQGIQNNNVWLGLAFQY